MFLFRKYELTPRQKEFLELEKKNYRQKDIAEMWGITVGGVKKTAYRAHKRLRRNLENLDKI